jgi:hypothetical protein
LIYDIRLMISDFRSGDSAKYQAIAPNRKS